LCTIGQEYIISFWAKAIDDGAKLYCSQPFNTGSVELTSEWKKYSFTNIADNANFIISRFANDGNAFLIDKLRLEYTPARVAVLTGTVSSNIGSPDTDFTQTDFGTPKAALVFMSNANSTNNPQVDSSFSIGFWDGTNQRACYIGEIDEVSTQSSMRGTKSGIIARIQHESTGTVQAEYTIANTTDGVTLSLITDNTDVDRYVVIVLIAGHGVEALVDYVNGPAANESLNVDVGFRPNCIFSTGIGSTSEQGSYSLLSFGATSICGSILQASVAGYISHGNSTTNGEMRTSNTHGFMRHTTGGTNDWRISTSQFLHNGFKLINNGDVGTSDYQRIYFLALKTPGLNIHVNPVQAPTSTGNDSVTGLGFKPKALISCFGINTSFNSDLGQWAFSIGAGDINSAGAVQSHSADAVSTSDANSKYSTNVVDHLNHVGSALNTASIVSFDNDGYTLNWSTVSGNEECGWILAFQDNTAAKRFIGASNEKIYFKQ
jgi:hypothetical protein